MRRRRWAVAAIWLACLTVAFSGVSLGAVITGQVTDATGNGLPSQNFPYTWIDLFKINETGGAVWVANTNCYPLPGESQEGCADAEGDFQFSKNFDGMPLVAGDYRIDGHAQWYFSATVKVHFDGVNNVDAPTLALPPSPVELSFNCCPPPIPSGGGKLTWKNRVTNVGNQTLNLDAYSHLHFNLVPWPDPLFQLGKPGTPAAPINPLPLKLNLRRGTFKDVTQSIQIPGDLPDGCCICVNFRVTQAGNPLAPFVGSGFCVSKGDASATSMPLTPTELSHIPAGAVR